MLAPLAMASARLSRPEWRKEFMDFFGDSAIGMAFGTDAVDRTLIADQASAAGETERVPVDLSPIGGIDIQVDQPRRGMPGFKMYTGFFDRIWIGVEAKDRIRSQNVVEATRLDDAGQHRRQLVQHPDEKRFSPGRNFVRTGDVQRQEQRRRMPRTQGARQGVLPAVPRCQVAATA